MKEFALYQTFMQRVIQQLLSLIWIFMKNTILWNKFIKNK